MENAQDIATLVSQLVSLILNGFILGLLKKKPNA